MHKNYQAFLLRIQRRSEQASWHASLEDAHSHQLARFKTIQELLDYLSQTFVEEKTIQGFNLENEQEY